MRASRARGFTLLELVVVIVLMGIVGAMVGSLVRPPVEAYITVARRAELTDLADLALRRIGQDIHAAVPNSLRVSSDAQALELVLTNGGGRYRAVCQVSGETNSACNVAGNNVLDFTTTDSAFDVLGGAGGLLGARNFQVGDVLQVVIGNLGQSGASLYAGDNVATATVTATGLSLSAGKKFPVASNFKRFQIIEGAVSYVCDAANARLLRFSGYALQSSQPTTLAGLRALPNVREEVLVGDVVCGAGDANNLGTEFGTPSRALDAGELIGLTLQLRHAGGESVALHHEVTVANGP